MSSLLHAAALLPPPTPPPPPLQDYPGAFLCLANGDCDVAFTKEGSWPPTAVADYELLCAPGSPIATAPLTAYSQCNLAVVPSHPVVTSPGTTAAEISAMQVRPEGPCLCAAAAACCHRSAARRHRSAAARVLRVSALLTSEPSWVH
jgi:Transferrin